MEKPKVGDILEFEDKQRRVLGLYNNILFVSRIKKKGDFYYDIDDPFEFLDVLATSALSQWKNSLWSIKKEDYRARFNKRAAEILEQLDKIDPKHRLAYLSIHLEDIEMQAREEK